MNVYAGLAVTTLIAISAMGMAIGSLVILNNAKYTLKSNLIRTPLVKSINSTTHLATVYNALLVGNHSGILEDGSFFGNTMTLQTLKTNNIICTNCTTVVGPQGPPGVAGQNGTNGYNGSVGAQGPPGQNGTDGSVGTQGPPGPNVLTSSANLQLGTGVLYIVNAGTNMPFPSLNTNWILTNPLGSGWTVPGPSSAFVSSISGTYLFNIQLTFQLGNTPPTILSIKLMDNTNVVILATAGMTLASAVPNSYLTIPLNLMYTYSANTQLTITLDSTVNGCNVIFGNVEIIRLL